MASFVCYFLTVKNWECVFPCAELFKSKCVLESRYAILTPQNTVFMRTTKNKQISKYNLPQKTCRVCGLDFTWRKKWEKVWDEVQYCSDKCRIEKKRNPKISL